MRETPAIRTELEKVDAPDASSPSSPVQTPRCGKSTGNEWCRTRQVFVARHQTPFPGPRRDEHLRTFDVARRWRLRHHFLSAQRTASISGSAVPQPEPNGRFGACLTSAVRPVCARKPPVNPLDCRAARGRTPCRIQPRVCGVAPSQQADAIAQAAENVSIAEHLVQRGKCGLAGAVARRDAL